MKTARGVTLVEVLIATAVLGVLGVASLQASAVAASLRKGTAERLAIARQCEALLDTAIALPYDDLIVADATQDVEVISGGGGRTGGGGALSGGGRESADETPAVQDLFLIEPNDDVVFRMSAAGINGLESALPDLKQGVFFKIKFSLLFVALPA
mgnify:CR=1 FL=1